MATRELHDLITCRVDACGLQVQEEQEDRPANMIHTLTHEWPRVEPAICSAALERLSHQTTAFVCESARARDGAAGTFPSLARALPRHGGVCQRLGTAQALWTQGSITEPSLRKRSICQPFAGNTLRKRTVAQKCQNYSILEVIEIHAQKVNRWSEMRSKVYTVQRKCLQRDLTSTEQETATVHRK